MDSDPYQLTLVEKARRVWRRWRGQCVTCARNVRSKSYWYCSIECSCYDGTFCVRTDSKPDHKPTLWRGHVDHYRQQDDWRGVRPTRWQRLQWWLNDWLQEDDHS